jgi:hypothetical protein
VTVVHAHGIKERTKFAVPGPILPVIASRPHFRLIFWSIRDFYG